MKIKINRTSTGIYMIVLGTGKNRQIMKLMPEEIYQLNGQIAKELEQIIEDISYDLSHTK